MIFLTCEKKQVARLLFFEYLDGMLPSRSAFNAGYSSSSLSRSRVLPESDRLGLPDEGLRFSPLEP